MFVCCMFRLFLRLQSFCICSKLSLHTLLKKLSFSRWNFNNFGQSTRYHTISTLMTLCHHMIITRLITSVFTGASADSFFFESFWNSVNQDAKIKLAKDFLGSEKLTTLSNLTVPVALEKRGKANFPYSPHLKENWIQETKAHVHFVSQMRKLRSFLSFMNVLINL